MAPRDVKQFQSNAEAPSTVMFPSLASKPLGSVIALAAPDATATNNASTPSTAVVVIPITALWRLVAAREGTPCSPPRTERSQRRVNLIFFPSGRGSRHACDCAWSAAVRCQM